jgi:hypothetical protein
MASSARAATAGSYWEQFYSALTCGTREEAEKWMDEEVARYVREFQMSEGDAWRTIVCNLAFFSGYFDTQAVRKIRTHFGGLDECFESPEFNQAKRQCMNESGKPAKDSPV